MRTQRQRIAASRRVNAGATPRCARPLERKSAPGRCGSRPLRTHSLGAQNFADRCGEVLYASGQNDDDVAAAMSFLGDAQKFTAVVFVELHMEMLALNL